MIASPYSIPSSKKALEVTDTPYYAPTAPPKTFNAARSHQGSRVMGIVREESKNTSPPAHTSNETASNHVESSSSTSTSSVIYVPVSTTAKPAQPFGVPIVPAPPVTPTFSVGMKNDKHK